MSRRPTLAQKIKSYPAIASAFLAAQQMANAQIVYTDLPDTSGSKIHFPHEVESDYFLDLNNDGVDEGPKRVAFNINSRMHS